MLPYLRWIRRRLGRSRTGQRSGSFLPGIEALEDRYLLTNYIVTTTKDVLNDATPGEVTLRDVLTAINSQAPSGNAAGGTATNTVKFAIGAPGTVQTIDVGSGNIAAPLPAITHEVFLDGWSQGVTKTSGPPLIVLNGANASIGADGLEFEPGSNGSTVRGLVIQQFGGNGIELQGSSHDLITGNYIGTDSTGTVALGNGGGIVLDQGASDNTIGGTTAGAANLICNNLTSVSAPTGNATQGAVLAISPASISGSVASFDIEVNYKDTPPSEMVYLGIDVRASSTILAPINPLTSQPDYSAFNFDPSSTLGSGWAPVGNAFPGEFLYQTPPPPGLQPVDGLQPNSTYLLGTLTYNLAEFNISPSALSSLSIEGTDTVIGAEQAGKPSTFNFITPTFAPGQQPLVNNASITTGIEISGSGTSNNVVVGNLIGTTKTGAAPLGHFTNGLLLANGATDNIVGGTASGAGNVIAGNDVGIAISDSGTNGNQILGNHIGTNLSSTANFRNALAGVFIENGAMANTVGGTTPGTKNTIAYNGQGVIVGSTASDTETIHNTILGNSIFSNLGLGIDVGNLGVTTPSRTTFGGAPNDGLNTPVITSLTLHTISSSLTGVANTPFRIEFFTTPVGSSANQGQVFLGFLKVTTSPTGSANFTLPIANLPPGQVVTATATNLATGDTSDFSPPGTQLLILSNPVSSPSTAGQVVTLSAQLIFNNLPVTSGKVTFTIAGVPGVVTATPGANGIATVTFAIPAGSTPGQYTILASFPGDQTIDSAVGTGSLTIPAGRTARRWNR